MVAVQSAERRWVIERFVCLQRRGAQYLQRGQPGGDSNSDSVKKIVAGNSHKRVLLISLLSPMAQAGYYQHQKFIVRPGRGKAVEIRY
ncbi:hypothetical protein BBW68_03625 [Candidatus Erwinia dacicola]|uniref:Uncharacterized protein n=1 Tax=Candidatus Erwinia dacicola TaxID=252393 RepID=A0A1E7Z4Z8_9GAMM|nr:hypothetical protein BBW68_03625 [Candidatus Erwinia dacicola]